MCFETMPEVKKGIKSFSKHMKPILLLGENGTGKETVARTIHAKSKKGNLPFMKLNCLFRQEQDIQSQLFKPKEEGNNAKNKQVSGKKVVYLSNIESLSKILQEKLAEVLQNITIEHMYILLVIIY